MPDRGPSKNAYNNGLSYVASKPKFLQNFGQPPCPRLDGAAAQQAAGRLCRAPKRRPMGEWQ